ncbi:MAG TPA: hypothetical protein VGN32_20595, partial [Ktedonobacterales bacterium]|nr:hypothetical protein [Ktedonobacterales bacterium]
MREPPSDPATAESSPVALVAATHLPLDAAEPPNSAEGDAGEERLFAAFRRRLIALEDMGPAQKAVVRLTLALLALVALLLLTSALPQPVVPAGVTSTGLPLQAPLLIFSFMALALVIGWTLVLAGALGAVWYIRYPVVAVSTLVLGIMPVVDLSVTFTTSGAWSLGLVLEVGFRLTQVGILLAFWAWAVRTSLARRRAGAAAVAASPPATAWPTRTVVITAGMVVLYYVLEIAVWLTNLSLGTALATRFTTTDISFQSNGLVLFLDLVVFWAATDLAEWGIKLSGAVVATVQRGTASPWVLGLLAGAGGLVVVVNEVEHDNFGHLLIQMGYVLLIAGIGWCLFWVARLRPPWPTALPITAPPAGAVLLFSVFSLAALGGVVISQSIGQPLRAPAEDAFQTMLALLCVIVA